MTRLEKMELYDAACRAMTEYDDPEASGCNMAEAIEDMYNALADITVKFEELIAEQEQPLEIISDMAFCRACKYAVSRHIRYCPHCGTKVKREEC